MKRGLSKREELFCLEIAKGETLTKAYIASHPRCEPGDDPSERKLVGTRASKLAAKPHIRQRIEEMQKAFKVNDLASVGATMAAVLRNVAAAEEKGDHKAVAALLRLQAQMQGSLTTQMVIMEEKSGDRSLVERLAKGKPELAAQLDALLAGESFAGNSGPKTVQ